MLQIVPESDQRKHESNVKSSLLIPAENSSTQTFENEGSLNTEEAKTKELLLKVEEMGRRKDAERRKRREQRMAERLQQTRSNRELNDLINEDELERDTHTFVYDEASAQGITDMTEELLNPQAYSTNSMTE